MYICLCKGLSETNLRAMARKQALAGDRSIESFIESLHLEEPPVCGLCLVDTVPFIDLALSEWSRMPPDDLPRGLF